MVKTPASDFSAEISAKWALWPLPGPGLAAANRGLSAAPSKNFCQAMKFFVHVIVHVPSPVLPSRSLLAALGTLAARATHGGFNRVSLQFYYGQHCRTTALRFGLVV